MKWVEQIIGCYFANLTSKKSRMCYVTPLTLSNSVKARECSPAILGVYVCYIFKVCSLNVDINYVIVTVMKNIVLHHYSRVVMIVQFSQDSIVRQCFSVTSIS